MSYKPRKRPDHNLNGWPSGIPFIVGNEGCERFSYYGMNAILYVYVVSLLANQLDFSAASMQATTIVHVFKAGVYAFPMIGAIISDRFLGKYQTILWLSLVYCFGHLVLSLSEGSIGGLYFGLALIAVGSGGIKPCVSAHVGDQFGRSNWHMIGRVYQVFYFIINFGSFFATLLIPLTKEMFGFAVAFAIPGILMFVATIFFWLGRKSFVHVPAAPGGRLGLLDALSSVLLFMTLGSVFFTANFPLWVIVTTSSTCFGLGIWTFQVRQRIAQDSGFLAVVICVFKNFATRLFVRPQSAEIVQSGNRPGLQVPILNRSLNQEVRDVFGDEPIDGALAVLRIVSVFFLVSIFWALFDQHSSSWIRQAQMMDRTVAIPWFGQISLLPSQIPSLNPLLVMILIPVLSYFILPFFSRIGLKVTPLRKMTVGMAIASLSFISVAILQRKINQHVALEQISVLWQLIPYILITLAEVLVSVTGLEFAYTQAPKRMKSTVMGFWLLTVAFGNVLVALTAHFSNLELDEFFWVFALLMAGAACAFGIRAANFTARDYPQ